MGSRAVTLATASLVAVAVALPPGVVGAADGPATTVAFEFTGAAETFTVPHGVMHIDVVACGAEGGEGVLPAEYPTTDAGRGGLGGRVSAAVAVTPGEVLVVVVGGAGAPGVGGFNGGGNGFDLGPGFARPGGGGGASDVRRGAGGLDERVVIAGGGGGGGTFEGGSPASSAGGGGGGADGGDGAPAVTGGGGASATAGGIGGAGSAFQGTPGSLGEGASGGLGLGAAGGGGGLYGGGSGAVDIGPPNVGGGGGGGSGLGDSHEPGVCAGDGTVQISYRPPPVIRPFGVLVQPEGDSGSTTWRLPVSLSAPSTEPVTVEFRSLDGIASGLATAGSDFVVTSGQVTFAPGETVHYVDVEVVGDTVDEPPLLWGEWGLVQFFDPSPNAVLDTTTFFGAGLFIIVDDD